MGWSHFWLERASRAADRRRRRYEVEPPSAIKKSIYVRDAPIGFPDSIRLFVYLLLGTLKGLSTLTWRFLTDRDTPGRRREIDALAREMEERLSAASTLAIGYFERRLYSRDLARVPKILEKLLFRTTPLVVVHVGNERDVISIMRFAQERGIPVYPRGASSSAFGGTIPTQNGLVLDLSLMSEILDVDPAHLTVRLQPSVRWADLAQALDAFGLSSLTTPSSRFSTVAGWISTGGLGIESFKYGHVRRAVLSARLILPGGRAVEWRSQDERFQYLFGTEGQIGIITDLVIRVRPKSNYSGSQLFYFKDERAAIGFVDQVIKLGGQPSHIVFYDRAWLAEENRLFRDRRGLAEAIVEEREAVLIHFDDAESEKTFLGAIRSSNSYRLSSSPAADYLWSERYFPLKAQRLGPNLLASEVLLDRQALPKFIPRARRLAKRFGLDLGLEVIFVDGAQCLAISSFRCNSRKFASYMSSLLLVQMLVHLGTTLGGFPYGIGIWNTPFLRKRFPAQARLDLKRLKKQIDPNWILNPRKYFKLRARFFNILGWAFNPQAYSAGLAGLRLLSPIIGLPAKLMKPEPEESWTPPGPEDGKTGALLSQAALRCAFCGACVSVCPAYLLTGDELVTGRAKLRLAEAMQSRSEISPAEAARAFLCLRCGLCEEVCQTRLPLVECYSSLEARLEKRFGRPIETIGRFVESVDKSREWIERTFGLSVADWSPGKRTEKSSRANQAAAGGTR